jgi:hypothetical protein
MILKLHFWILIWIRIAAPNEETPMLNPLDGYTWQKNEMTDSDTEQNFQKSDSREEDSKYDSDDEIDPIGLLCTNVEKTTAYRPEQKRTYARHILQLHKAHTYPMLSPP